jgi:hypothetical protein
MLCMPRITQAEHAQAIARIQELTKELETVKSTTHTEAQALHESVLAAKTQLDKLEAELHERDEALAREQGEWVVAKQGLEQALEEEREATEGLRTDYSILESRLSSHQDALRAQYVVLVTLLAGFFAAFTVLAGLRCDLGPEL